MKKMKRIGSKQMGRILHHLTDSPKILNLPLVSEGDLLRNHYTQFDEILPIRKYVGCVRKML